MRKIKCSECSFSRQHGSIDHTEQSTEVLYCPMFCQFRAADLERECVEFEPLLNATEGGAA